MLLRLVRSAGARPSVCRANVFAERFIASLPTPRPMPEGQRLVRLLRSSIALRYSAHRHGPVLVMMGESGLWLGHQRKCGGCLVVFGVCAANTFVLATTSSGRVGVIPGGGDASGYPAPHQTLHAIQEHRETNQRSGKKHQQGKTNRQPNRVRMPIANMIIGWDAMRTRSCFVFR